MRSRDSLTWEKLPDAVPARPSWATGNPDHWAPQVVKRNSKFLMYVSLPRGEESCLSVGKAKSPAGPYNEFSILACSKDFRLVNPLLHKEKGVEFLSWEDPSWKNLVRRDLDSSGEKFLAGSSFSSEDLMTSKYRFQRKGYEDLVEGAWVSFHDGYYYLYYSGNECCSSEAHYAVSVARAKSPFGPYEKQGVILKGNSQWLGPGHNSVVTDEKGQDWIVFHAIPSTDRVLHVNESETEVNRVMLIEKINYSWNGWPKVVK
jgi:arabinan endo-1,5-alpha-L-arabinosidase